MWGCAVVSIPDLKKARRARLRISREAEARWRGVVERVQASGDLTLDFPRPDVARAEFYRVREYWRAASTPLATEADLITCRRDGPGRLLFTRKENWTWTRKANRSLKDLV